MERRGGGRYDLRPLVQSSSMSESTRLKVLFHSSSLGIPWMIGIKELSIGYKALFMGQISLIVYHILLITCHTFASDEEFGFVGVIELLSCKVIICSWVTPSWCFHSTCGFRNVMLCLLHK